METVAYIASKSCVTGMVFDKVTTVLMSISSDKQ